MGGQPILLTGEKKYALDLTEEHHSSFPFIKSKAVLFKDFNYLLLSAVSRFKGYGSALADDPGHFLYERFQTTGNMPQAEEKSQVQTCRCKTCICSVAINYSYIFESFLSYLSFNSSYESGMEVHGPDFSFFSNYIGGRDSVESRSAAYFKNFHAFLQAC